MEYSQVLVLLLSALKAVRVRRGARALRRDRAARKIVLLLRRQLAQRKVTDLRHKHAWWTVLNDVLAYGAESPSPPSTPKGQIKGDWWRKAKSDDAAGSFKDPLAAGGSGSMKRNSSSEGKLRAVSSSPGELYRGKAPPRGASP